MTKDEKQCPFCAETIKKSAIKCRFCQSELTKEEINPSKQIKTSKKLTSKEEVEIDYLAEKIASGTTSIVSWLFGIGIIALIFYFITGSNPINFFNNSKTKTYTLEELISSPVVNIDPEKLTSTFQFFSDYTDLQREKLEKDLNGKVVIWELEVYDIKSTKDPKVFKIQTSDGTSKSESLGLAGVNKELDSQLGKLFQGWSDEINKSISGKKTNHSVGTWITLHARNAMDVSQLESLKTGSWIKVKGRINGTFLRAINLDPAIIYHKTEASDNGNNSKDCVLLKDQDGNLASIKKTYECYDDKNQPNICLKISDFQGERLNGFTSHHVIYKGKEYAFVEQAKRGVPWYDQGVFEWDKKIVEKYIEVPTKFLGKFDEQTIFYFEHQPKSFTTMSEPPKELHDKKFRCN
jgi:hypothetical protein